jgi:protein TonB
MRVYDKGKEVFRMTGQGYESEGGMQRAASVEPERVLELSPSAAESSLLHRVEPDYPEAARQQGIQGAVVLDVHIGADGAVQDVQVVSGPEQLRQTAIEAVKQWRFRARGALLQTRVTLNFRLP